MIVRSCDGGYVGQEKDYEALIAKVYGLIGQFPLERAQMAVAARLSRG